MQPLGNDPRIGLHTYYVKLKKCECLRANLFPLYQAGLKIVFLDLAPFGLFSGFSILCRGEQQVVESGAWDQLCIALVATGHH